MKCRVCNTRMLLDYCESGTGATTCWHRCPLCRQVRLHSEPRGIFSDDNSGIKQHIDDDRGYAGEPSERMAPTAIA